MYLKALRGSESMELETTPSPNLVSQHWRNLKIDKQLASPMKINPLDVEILIRLVGEISLLEWVEEST